MFKHIDVNFFTKLMLFFIIIMLVLKWKINIITFENVDSPLLRNELNNCIHQLSGMMTNTLQWKPILCMNPSSNKSFNILNRLPLFYTLIKDFLQSSWYERLVINYDMQALLKHVSYSVICLKTLLKFLSNLSLISIH